MKVGWGAGFNSFFSAGKTTDDNKAGTSPTPPTVIPIPTKRANCRLKSCSGRLQRTSHQEGQEEMTVLKAEALERPMDRDIGHLPPPAASGLASLAHFDLSAGYRTMIFFWCQDC